jgi:hypothetical protein
MNSEYSKIYNNLNMSHERYNISQNQCQGAKLCMHFGTQFSYFARIHHLVLDYLPSEVEYK